MGYYVDQACAKKYLRTTGFNAAVTATPINREMFTMTQIDDGPGPVTRFNSKADQLPYVAFVGGAPIVDARAGVLKATVYYVFTNKNI